MSNADDVLRAGVKRIQELDDEVRRLRAENNKLVKKLKVELCRTELATISKKFVYQALKKLRR